MRIWEYDSRAWEYYEYGEDLSMWIIISALYKYVWTFCYLPYVKYLHLVVIIALKMIEKLL